MLQKLSFKGMPPMGIIVVFFVLSFFGAFNLGKHSSAASILQGPRGSKGAEGTQGTNGVNGEDGDVGTLGSRGLVGPRGPKGNTGAAGPKGENGNDANSVDYIKSGQVGDNDISLASSGPFTLIGRCIDTGDGIYEGRTFLHSSDNGSMGTFAGDYGDGPGAQAYIFSSINTEMVAARVVSNRDYVDNDPPTFNNTVQGPRTGPFTAITSDKDRYIIGEQSVALENADSGDPTCTWAGSIKTVLK